MQIEGLLGIVYDVLFVVLVLVMAWRGRKQGFLSGLLGLGCTVLGIAGGAWASNTWAVRLYREHIGVTIGQRLGETIESAGSDVTEAIAGLHFLPASVRSLLTDALTDVTGDIVPHLVTALEPVVLPLVQVLVFLLCCALVRLLTRLAARALRGVNALPLVGSANRMLGLVFGIVTGLLDCWLAAMALWLLSMLTSGDVVLFAPATLAHSAVYRFLANFNVFLGSY